MNMQLYNTDKAPLQLMISVSYNVGRKKLFNNYATWLGYIIEFLI